MCVLLPAHVFCFCMYIYMSICMWMYVCIPPQSSSGTLRLVGESLPSGWTHQPPAVCHLSYAQTHISSSLATSICKRFACMWVCLVDGHVNKSKNHSCSLKHKPSRHSHWWLQPHVHINNSKNEIQQLLSSLAASKQVLQNSWIKNHWFDIFC